MTGGPPPVDPSVGGTISCCCFRASSSVPRTAPFASLSVVRVVSPATSAAFNSAAFTCVATACAGRHQSPSFHWCVSRLSCTDQPRRGATLCCVSVETNATPRTASCEGPGGEVVDWRGDTSESEPGRVGGDARGSDGGWTKCRGTGKRRVRPNRWGLGTYRPEHRQRDQEWSPPPRRHRRCRCV